MKGTFPRPVSFNDSSFIVPPSSFRSIIRCSSADPVANELDLRVGQRRLPLRHAVTGDARAGDLAVEIRVGGVEGGDAQQRGHLDARLADGVDEALSVAEDHALLSAERVVA